MERKKTKELEKDIENIKHNIQTLPPTNLIKFFFDLIMCDHYSILMYLLIGELKIINEQVQKPIQKQMNELKDKKLRNTNSSEKMDLKEKISKLYLKSLGSAISLEVLFRNIFPYLQENDSWLQDERREKFKSRLMDILLDGFCLELIDGENSEFIPKFFVDLMHQMGKAKVITIGCMGPQSSGKSTLLNYMFGTQFATSQGRCTSGLFLSLQCISNEKSAVEYILIVDSEGLDGSERGDSQYDRKICSFLMNNVDLLLVNVKGEMNHTMTKNLEMTLFTANNLRSFKKVPKVYFVFNQSNVNDNKTKSKLFRQISGMNNKIEGGIKNLDLKLKKEDIHLFNLDEKYLIVLGHAFKEHLRPKNYEFGQNEDFQFKDSNELFGQNASKLAQGILDHVLRIEKGKADNSFCGFFSKSFQSWQMVERFADLTNDSDLDMLQRKKEIDQLLEKVIENLKNDL